MSDRDKDAEILALRHQITVLERQPVGIDPAPGRCTYRRWTWDIPFIQPAAGGEYWVSGPTRIETVGPAATAAEAVAMVLERLPANCGPAFVGTPEELAAHETRQKAVEDRATGRGWRRHGPGVKMVTE